MAHGHLANGLNRRKPENVCQHREVLPAIEVFGRRAVADPLGQMEFVAAIRRTLTVMVFGLPSRNETLRMVGQFERCRYGASCATSPLARVAKARHVPRSICSAIVRTEPSTKTACTTPAW